MSGYAGGLALLLVLVLEFRQAYGHISDPATVENGISSSLWYWLLSGAGIVCGISISVACACCGKKSSSSSKDDAVIDLESGVPETDHTYYNLSEEEAGKKPSSRQSFVKRVELENGDVYALPKKGHEKGRQKPAVAPKPIVKSLSQQEDDVPDDDPMYDSIDPPEAENTTPGAPSVSSSSPTTQGQPSVVFDPKATAAEEEGELEDIYNVYIPDDPTLIQEAQRFGARESVTPETVDYAEIGDTDVVVKDQGPKEKPKEKPKVTREKGSVERQKTPVESSTSQKRAQSSSSSTAEKLTASTAKKAKEKPKEKPAEKSKEKPKPKENPKEKSKEKANEKTKKSKEKPKEKLKVKPQPKPNEKAVESEKGKSKSVLNPEKSTVVDPVAVAAEQEGEMEDFYTTYVPDDPSLMQEPERFGSKHAKEAIVSETVQGQSQELSRTKSKEEQKKDSKASGAKAEKAKSEKAKMEKHQSEKAKLEKAKSEKAKTEKAQTEKAKPEKAKSEKAKLEKPLVKRKKPKSEVSIETEPDYYNVGPIQPTSPQPQGYNSETKITSPGATAKANQAGKDKKGKNKETKKKEEKEKKTANSKAAEKLPEQTPEPLYDYASIGQVASLRLPNGQESGSGSGSGVVYHEIPGEKAVAPPTLDDVAFEMEENDLYDRSSSRQSLGDIGLEIEENDMYDSTPMRF